jgi:hypothetical protein
VGKQTAAKVSKSPAYTFFSSSSNHFRHIGQSHSNGSRCCISSGNSQRASLLAPFIKELLNGGGVTWFIHSEPIIDSRRSESESTKPGVKTRLCYCATPSLRLRANQNYQHCQRESHSLTPPLRVTAACWQISCEASASRLAEASPLF